MTGSVPAVAQQEPADDDEPSILRDVDSPELSELTDLDTVGGVVREALAELVGDLVVRLPLVVLAFVVLILLLVGTWLIVGVVRRGMTRAEVDFSVHRLVSNLLRLLLIAIAALVALSIAGVEIGAVLAGLGLIGLGLALALQNILENFIAGVLILVRKPFHRGELVNTNDVEGFVEDIDLRATTIRTYDGTLTLIPNADVFTQPLTNLTRRGTRRGTVAIGVDYRDDHEAAREVLLIAVHRIDEVLDDPAPAVLLRELGDSSVDFEVRFWINVDESILPFVEDRILRACKTAIEAAGMTIPWPIRTLAADMHPLRIAGVPDPLSEPDESDGPRPTTH